MLIGVSGLAGSGKDTVADILVKNHGFVKVALADPLKRIVRDVYDFTDEQLWGPSEKRVEPDYRYPRPTHEWENSLGEVAYRCACCGVLRKDIQGPPKNSACFLTPRYALQMLGTEWGRKCYPGTWVDYGLRVAEELLKDVDYPPCYSYKSGLHYEADGHAMVARELGTIPPLRAEGVTISDVRFWNEVLPISKNGRVLRVKRTGYEKPQWNHPSETEQLSIPDDKFDYVLQNAAGLQELEQSVASMLEELRGGSMQP